MSVEVHGTTAPGFERVRDVFAKNFSKRREVGASFCVRLGGEPIVDLWGGVADPTTGRAWEADTPAIVFSATKGMAAARMLQLTDQGVFDPDAPVADAWPAFGRAGKERITGRVLMNHRGGLAAIDEKLDLNDFADPRGKVHDALVAQEPLWEPDTDQGYHACSYGPYVSELHHQLTGQTLGEAFREHVSGPLDADVWIGAPDDAIARSARMVVIDPKTLLTRHIPTALLRRNHEARLYRRLFRPGSDVFRAFTNPAMGPERLGAVNHASTQRLELAWMGALASARGLSKVYAGLLGPVDGQRLVSEDAVRPLHRRQTWSQRDRVLQKPLGWSQGFLKDERRLFSPNSASFGHAGAGGPVGWADPVTGLSFAYVMNRMDWRIRSPRCVALCRAVYRCLDERG